MQKEVVYVVDDDKKICDLLKIHLEKEDYIVKSFYDGNSILKEFLREPCSLIIMDIMMPHMSGYELCKEIRKISDVPIIMVSAKDEEVDRIVGLELGSDDYIAKPFSLREITIKVRNMLRRANSNKERVMDGTLICRNLEVLKNNRQILIEGKELKVTNKEYELLELLITNKNQAFSREMLIEKIWGYDYYGESRQVDHLIKRLRKKMLLSESECKIETVWGYGYKVSE